MHNFANITFFTFEKVFKQLFNYLIMKKFLISSACLASVGLFFLGHKTPEKASDLIPDNIETVGISASEVVCDSSNDKVCQALKDGKVVMEARGMGTYWE